MHKVSALYSEPVHSTAKLYLNARKAEQLARDTAFKLVKDTRNRLAIRVKSRVERAKEKGFNAGFAAGQDEITKFISAFEQNKEDYFFKLEKQLLKLLLSICQEILQTEMLHNQAAIERLLKKVVQDYQQEQILHICVAPEQQELFKNIALKVHSDSDVAPGNFKIQLSSGSLKTDWQKQLKKIAAQLEIKLNGVGNAKQ